MIDEQNDDWSNLMRQQIGELKAINKRLERLEQEMARSGERVGKTVNRAATRKTLCDPRA